MATNRQVAMRGRPHRRGRSVPGIRPYLQAKRLRRPEFAKTASDAGNCRTAAVFGLNQIGCKLHATPRHRRDGNLDRADSNREAGHPSEREQSAAAIGAGLAVAALSNTGILAMTLVEPAG
jgi:hypothetical protein